MAKVEKWFAQDLKKSVPVRYLDGSFFNEDAAGNRIGVEVYSDGEAVTLAGSITGYCVRPDGTTVPISGVRSSNRAYIDIPQSALAVPGPLTVTIKNTESSVITTLCAVVGIVTQSRTGVQVDPGQTITDWTNQISAQLQAVQTAADNLGSTLAVPYDSLTFPVTAGTYTVYNGNVYRANQDISTSEEWTPSHWTQVKVCNEIYDLKTETTELAEHFPATGKLVAGISTTASANGAVATGVGTTASGRASHAEGQLTTAEGQVAHAEGYGTTASGDYSHAEGFGTKASGDHQHAFGKYNVEDTNDTYLELAGNGTGDNARSNARTLDWNGNEALAGDLTVNKGGAEEMEVGSELSSLKSAFDSSLVPGTLPGWEKGSFDTTNGNNYSENSRIRNQRTVGYATGVCRFELNAGYKTLMFAWDLSGNYVGAYKTDGTWTKTASNWKAVTEFNLATIPNYVIKFSVARDPLSSDIAASEGDQVILYNYTDKTHTQANKAADAKATGDEIRKVKSALYDKILYDGKGNTYAEYTYDGRLRPGNSYRVYVKHWDTTGITVTSGYMFRLGYTSNGIITYLYSEYGNDSSILKEFYDVSIPANAVNPMFAVGGRATGIAILGIENGELVLDPVFHSEVDPLKSDVTALMLGNAPTKQRIVGKRGSSSAAYDVMQINVESGRRYRIDMSNIDALVGADLYLRVRKADNSGNAYTATTISGNIPANTKWTYYFNCTVTESVVVQIYRAYLTEDAIFSVGVLCDDDRRDISTLMSDLSFVNEKVNMDVSRNLTGPDLNVLYPIPPLKDNDVITISAFNPANVNSYTQVYFYEEDGTWIKYWQFDSGYASAGRQITLNLDGKTAHFIKFVHDCGSPLMVERGTKTDFIPHYTTNYEKYLNGNSNFGEFELFLPDQAEIIRKNLAPARMAKRLCFGHVSDNHSTAEKFISDIVDMSDAKFIANTGDIVQDKFQDAYTTFPAMINAMTKPYYITLGNHDVYKAPSVSDIFNKYFAPIIDHNGQTGLNKTYYSVDFTDEGIKCIFLDLYDAIADYSISMETVIAGKMSATQINWFLGQLDAALASHMHVCVFLHLSPEMVGEKELKFFDVNTTESQKVTYTFIPDVIDAFLDGGSVTFNYDGSSYTHTFASSGVFVGYFCGHMHCDCIGKLKTHNRQNAFSVTRPWQSSTTNTLTDGTYRHGSSKWGSSTFNYVTVDPTTRHVSVMRVLQQETKYGFKRDFVTMEY